MEERGGTEGEKRESTWYMMSFKRHPTHFYPHTVTICGTLLLGIYPSLVGFQALPVKPPPTSLAVSSQCFPPIPVAAQ